MDLRIIYFRQFDSDIMFGLTFYIGGNKLDIQQYGEDKYYLFIDGIRFYDLMVQERIERQALIKKKERDKQKMKKMEDDYYKRALKYNGKDYYEGKEKNLLNNNNYNNNYNNNKYNYDYYKQNKNNNIIYGYDNDRNNNFNYPINNYNNNNNYYQQNQNQIINQNDIKQIKQNINKNKYNNNNYNNPYMEEEPKENDDLEINNPYPSFSQYQNTENNIGYNNRPNFNDYNNAYDNNHINNNNNNNNYMNQLEEVFSNDNNINQKQSQKNSIKKNELPTYSELVNNQNQKQNQLSKKNSKDNNLISYIGNLNKSGNNNIQQTSAECAPNVKENGYNFGFDEDNNDYKMDENKKEIELNIYNNKDIEKERNKKKLYMNKSSFQNPLKEEDYDMENPYNDY